MGALGTAAALWSAIFISILSQAPLVRSGFELQPIALALLIALACCFIGFEIGSRKRPALAPELGGLIVGAGVLAVHYLGLSAWHVAGTASWGWFGLAANVLFGLSLGALSVNRANRPVTRYCRHGAAIVLTFTVCVMHYTMFASGGIVIDDNVQLAADLIPASTLAAGIVCAVLLLIGSGFSSYIIDLKTRTESAERIHQLSFNDTMTGLPNRIAFNERLANDVLEAHEKAQKVAAYSIDIDGFKDINDVFGHDAGDRILIEVADRMRGALRPGEFLARQSGDEFLALKQSDDPAAAQEFAERIAAVLNQPLDVRGTTVKLTTSIGYALFPLDTPERSELLSHAKLAMYRGKTSARGQICRYDRGMDEVARDKRTLARDLHTALRDHELALHYQLQYSLEDGRFRGAEALMRWHHASRGPISPGVFIPLAEESELIVPMGEWALRTACRDAASGLVPGVVAVNLSPIQFKQRDLAQLIHAILIETGLPPSRLEIEITESTLMQDQAASLHTLRQLKAMGIAIAMDDFGTGYSSLATLHAFPFDKIKLDQSFVRRIPTDRSAVAIVRTVLALGRSLDIPVLAEGIETEEQRSFLAHEGCKEGQGYLFAKPVALKDLPGALAGTGASPEQAVQSVIASRSVA